MYIVKRGKHTIGRYPNETMAVLMAGPEHRIVYKPKKNGKCLVRYVTRSNNPTWYEKPLSGDNFYYTRIKSCAKVWDKAEAIAFVERYNQNDWHTYKCEVEEYVT